MKDNNVTKNECFQDLANAIVRQACEDYRAALRGKLPHNSGFKSVLALRRNCEKFFRGEAIKNFTNVRGEYLIEKLKQEVEQETKFIEYARKQLPEGKRSAGFNCPLCHRDRAYIKESKAGFTYHCDTCRIHIIEKKGKQQ